MSVEEYELDADPIWGLKQAEAEHGEHEPEPAEPEAAAAVSPHVDADGTPKRARGMRAVDRGFDPEIHYSQQQVAELFAVDRVTLRAWHQKGLIRPEMFDRRPVLPPRPSSARPRWRFLRERVDAALEGLEPFFVEHE